MANYKIRLIGPITQITGETLLDIKAAEGTTVKDLLKKAGRQYGEKVRTKILTSAGDFHPYVMASVNGIDIRELNGISTRLSDGDDVLVAINIVGG